MTKSNKLKPVELKANAYCIVPLDASIRQNLIRTDSSGRFKIISEVSPDAIVTSTLDLTNKLTGKLKSGVEFSAEQITKMTQSMHELGKRTVAVSILRDALYRLEEYNINSGGIKMTEDTRALFDSILSIAKQIALAEIAYEKGKVAVADANAKEAESNAKIALAQNKNSKTLTLIDTTKSDNYNNAIIWEQKGFNMLLSEDIEGSIAAFENVEKYYPTLHNAYEIKRILKKNTDKLKDKQSKEAKDVYKTIVDNYSWGMPEEIKEQIKNKAK